jgi:hypothetical protein
VGGAAFDFTRRGFVVRIGWALLAAVLFATEITLD